MIRNSSKEVIILGMHRSGTSMIGGVLSKLGVDMGKELVGKSWSNPLGHFEDKEFLSLNNRILEAAGGSWNSPPGRKAILSQKATFVKQIKNLIGKGDSEIWGWKDPRTSLTIELYMSYLADPYFLVCHRDPEAIAKSLKRRDKMNIEEARRLAERYEERIESFFRERPELRRLDLNYEEVTKNPEEWVQRVIEFVGIRPGEKAYREAVEFVLPNEVTHKLSKRVKLRLWMSLILKGIKAPWKIPGFISEKQKSRLSRLERRRNLP